MVKTLANIHEEQFGSPDPTQCVVGVFLAFEIRISQSDLASYTSNTGEL